MLLHRWMAFIFPLVLLAACSEEAAPPAGDVAEVVITEWVVPWPNSRPRDPYAASEDKVWFVGQRDGYLAYFNPGAEEFTQIMLPEGSGPHNIIADADGNAWFAGNVMGYIGLLKPDGDFIQIPMPEEVFDPHTLIEDGNGNIWFTSQGANRVGLLDKTNFSKTLFHISTPNARPYGITIAPDGRVWVALFGTGKLAMVDPETLELREISLPRTSARPRRIEATSDGMIWYVDYADGFLGRYDPERGDFAEWPMPSGSDAKPYGMAVDSKDRIWFVETGPQPNRFVGFDADTEEFFSSTEIESGGGVVRHMMYYPPTNTVWFATDANTLGRAELPE